MQVENIWYSLGCAGFQTPQMTVFGKIGCQSVSVHSISEKASAFRAHQIDKPVAVCDRKVIRV